MLEKQENDNIEIVNMIYEIRGQQVMLDSDLAKLYQILTGNLNKAVKRNFDRFPEDFMFQLTKQEYETLKFQNGISNTRGGTRKLPFVFTEQGVAMLASVLKTNIATEMSVRIMRAFVSMRRYISSNLLEQKYINNQVMKNTKDIKLLQESFKEFDKKKELNDMFFEGQFYDAYSLLIDIFNTATKNIIIIDNKTLYHCGASFKDLGKKCFCINKIENDNVLKKLLKIVNLLFSYSTFKGSFFIIH